LLQEVVAEGATVFLSSHDLDVDELFLDVYRERSTS